jgi:hypothetical protein
MVKKSEYQRDLWQPETLPVCAEVADVNSTEVCEQQTREGFTVQLTGWRGAGWRMVFLDETPTPDE